MNNKNNEASEPTEGTPLHIACPCNCGHAVPSICTSCPDDISELANQVWQQLVSEKGLESAIEFLHEKVDMG